jgi:DNA-binding transcriptional LysR family regulator
MDLLAISDFNLVAAHGGVGRASRATGRPKASLSRRIAELEGALGVRLFERGRRSLRLTDEGRSLHERTQPLLMEVAHAAEDIASGTTRPRGPLRVSAPSLFAHLAMGSIAAGFAAAYPDVRLEVIVEDRVVDLIEEGYDVAIRVNPQADTTLVGRRFLRDELLLVAAPSVARPGPSTTRKVRRVRAVALASAPTAGEWTVAQGSRTATFLPDFVLKLGTLTMVRDAVAAGAGAALLPRSLVSRDLASGALKSWGKASKADTEIWVLHSSRRLVSSKVSAFVGYLAEQFPKGSPDELGARPDSGFGRAI